MLVCISTADKLSNEVPVSIFGARRITDSLRNGALVGGQRNRIICSVFTNTSMGCTAYVNQSPHTCSPSRSFQIKSRGRETRDGVARATAPSVSSVLTYQQAPTVGACSFQCAEFQLRLHSFCIQSSEQPIVSQEMSLYDRIWNHTYAG